jgi:hypothetical protein
MGRLAWTETLEGWTSGRYRIELAAPALWVLTRTDDRRGTRIIETSGSLQALKNRASGIERRRERARSSLMHLLGVSVSVALALVVARLAPGLTVPAVVVVFVLSLRALVTWVDGVTGSAWDRISESYQ